MVLLFCCLINWHFLFPFSNKWFVFKKLWVALTVNVFLQKISSIYFITCKPSWIAYVVAILKSSLIPYLYLPNFTFYCAFSVVSIKSDFSFSFLQPIPGMGLCHLLHWLWSASLFQTHPSSPVIQELFHCRLGKVRFTYPSSLLPLHSTRKCSKTF